MIPKKLVQIIICVIVFLLLAISIVIGTTISDTTSSFSGDINLLDNSLFNISQLNTSGDVNLSGALLITNATLSINVTKNISISENATILGNLSVFNNISAASLSITRSCLDALCIDDWTEINTTSDEISGIMGFYYNIYNLTSLLNTTYLARTKGNTSGNYSFGGALFIDDDNNRISIGTPSPNSTLSVDGNVSIKGNLSVTANVSIGYDESNHYIYFYEGGSPTGEAIYWDDAGGQFYFTDNIYTQHTIQSTGGIVGGTTYATTAVYSLGDIYTTGAGDDLWLGDTTQGSAGFQANATGNVMLVNMTVTGNISVVNNISAHWISASNVSVVGSVTGNYTVGDVVGAAQESCWQYFSYGILTGTNCTSI